jgi:hypothetical protein
VQLEAAGRQQARQNPLGAQWRDIATGRTHAADAFRYLALTLDRKATHSGFYRRIDYPQHGVV